jgi:hypothetical protein
VLAESSIGIKFSVSEENNALLIPSGVRPRNEMATEHTIEHMKFMVMRFQVLTAASMKMTVFWDAAPCSLVDIYHISEALTR